MLNMAWHADMKFYIVPGLPATRYEMKYLTSSLFVAVDYSHYHDIIFYTG